MDSSICREQIIDLDELKAFPKERLLELIGRLSAWSALLSLKMLEAGAYGMPAPDELRDK